MWTRVGIIFIIFYSFYSQCSTENVMNNNDVPSGFGMRFRLPFIDMNIQSNSNLKIIKDAAGQQVFLLHGAELYRLVLERQIKRLTLIAHLGGDVKESELIGAEIISWRNYVLLVIAIEEHLEVYQFAKKTIADRIASPVNESTEPLVMEPIQQITLYGHFKGLFICESSEDAITLIVLVDFTKLYSRLNTYQWSETYFDPTDEQNIAPVQGVELIGFGSKYLVISRTSKSQTEITVTVYRVLTSLKQVQAMVLLSKSIKPFTYQGINYLLSCSKGRNKCTSFKMSDEQFSVYRNRPGVEFYFNYFTAGEHFLAGQKATEVSVFVDPRMECYGSFKTASNVTSILTHLNEVGNDFILLNYIQPYSTLVRIVEIEYEQKLSGTYIGENSGEDELDADLKQQKHAFEQTIKKLRYILLSRKYPFDEIKKSIGSIRATAKEFISKHPLRILAGQIGIVKLVASQLRSPLQLQKRLQSLSKGERKIRLSRGFQDNRNGTCTLDLKVKNLHVGNLIYDGDMIQGFNLNSDAKYLKIKSPVTTKIIETKELLTATVMESSTWSNSSSRSMGATPMRVQNLRLNRINGVSWDEFYQNLFLRSRDRLINGRLIMQSSVQFDNLWTLVLNGLATDKLFNLVEVQNVTSNIVISRFFVNDLNTDELNDLDFARDVARKGVENFIKSPVVAQDVFITGTLILSENDHRARHVFGTNVLDFQQTYTGKVMIEGSLTLVNLMMKNEKNRRLFVDNTLIPVNIASGFWMHSMPQTFVGPVSFTNCRVSTPNLKTLHLNDGRITDYLLNMDQRSSNPLLLIFLSTYIEGSLIADPTFGTKIRQINKDAVVTGDRRIIFGNKIFQGTLTFNHGELVALNDLPTNDLIQFDEKTCIFIGKKSFKSIRVTNEAIITKNLGLNEFNTATQDDNLFKTNYRFGTVVLRSPLKTNNVIFKYLNGFPSNKLFSNIRSVEHKLILHKDLYVEGSIQFESNLHVDVINNVVWEDYLRSLIRTNESKLINGSKTITSTLAIVTGLKTPLINEITIDYLFENVLLKSQKQVIKGAFTFDTVRLGNVNVSSLNQFHTSEFIDTQSPEVIFNCDLIVNKLQVNGNLFGGHGIDFFSWDQRIKALTLKPWRNIRILGNAYWPWGIDKQSLDLKYLFENAVRHLGDQVITGNIKLKKPLISTMNTKQIFPTDIDFDYIASDCLFHNSSIEEVVMAAKVFLKPIQLTEATALGHLGSPIINRVDILEFNSSLYRLSQPSILYGSLTFQVPPIFGQITVEGAINHMPPNNIFSAEGGRVWPLVKLQGLYIEGDLQLFDIEDMSLNFLLKNRVRKSGLAQEVFGHLTFNHLVLEKEIYMQSINNIAIDNVVQKKSESLQEISGPKTILGDLRLVGPARVARLNSEDVIERYLKTIFLDKNYNFDSLSIENAKFQNGLIVNSSFSKYLFDGEPDHLSYNETFQQHTENLKLILTNLREAEDIIEAKAMNARRLVYLDYDFSTIIEWKSTNDSIQHQFIFDNNRYQYCDREQTIVKWSKYHNRISLSKIITNTITSNEYGVQVTAENTCKDSYRNVNSRISITESDLIKTFTINKLVQSIEIYYAMDIFFLLHAIDIYAGNNEIRILKFDNNLKTIQDWQLLSDGVGKVSRLFKLQSHTILVVSTIIDNYPSITIYNLNANSKIFEVIQVIDGDFDVIELAQVTPYRYHLFLSCVHCQRIVIFEYDSIAATTEDCHLYHIYQIIKLKTRIDRFNLFTLPDGGIYLLVLSDQDIDFYHVYKYQYIQGWKHFTYGYFKNIQRAYALLRDGLSSVDGNLLLLCNRKCTLVKAFYQW